MLTCVPRGLFGKGVVSKHRLGCVPSLFRSVGPNFRGVPAPISAGPAASVPRPLPNAGQIKGVLFDIDGTLTDSDHLHYIAFRDLLAEREYNGGVPITREFFDEHISGGHNSYLGPYLWPDASPADQMKFMEDKEVVFRQKAAGVLKPIEGLREFLAWIDDNKLGKAAVSNAPRRNVEVMLEALGLASYFDAVILGEDMPRPKPYPDPYLEGLRVLGLKADEVIVVEDSPAGITAGKAAGIPTVGITTSQTPERLEAAGAVTTISDYRQLLRLVKGDTIAPPENGQL